MCDIIVELLKKNRFQDALHALADEKGSNSQAKYYYHITQVLIARQHIDAGDKLLSVEGKVDIAIATYNLVNLDYVSKSGRFQYYHNLGLAYLLKNEYSEAITKFSIALSIKKHNNVRTRELIAYCEFKCFKYSNSLLSLSNIISMYDCTTYANIAHIICMKGNLLFSMGNYDECIKLMTELIHSNPSYYPAYRIRGNSYRCLSISNNANKDYEIADRICGSLLKIECKDTRGCEKRLFMNESSCTVYYTEMDSLDNIPKHVKRKSIKDIIDRTQTISIPPIAPMVPLDDSSSKGSSHDSSVVSVDSVRRGSRDTIIAAETTELVARCSSRDTIIAAETIELVARCSSRDLDEVLMDEESPEYLRRTKDHCATLVTALKRFDDQSEHLFQSFKFPASSPLHLKFLLSPTLSEVVRIDQSAVTTLSSMTASLPPFSPESQTGSAIEDMPVSDSNVNYDGEIGEEHANFYNTEELPERKQSVTPLGALKLQINEEVLSLDSQNSSSSDQYNNQTTVIADITHGIPTKSYIPGGNYSGSNKWNSSLVKSKLVHNKDASTGNNSDISVTNKTAPSQVIAVDKIKQSSNSDSNSTDGSKQIGGVWILQSENYPSSNRQQGNGNQPVSMVSFEPSLRNRKFYSYDELTSASVPADVDLRCRELHLSDTNFLRIFKMTKETFIQLPKWRQINLRKQYKLW